MGKMEINNVFMLVDGVRCFYEASEGERLGLPGFGELPIKGAEKRIPNINKITLAVGQSASSTMIAIREDHPHETAHFSSTPDFITTWPPHGEHGTPGAEFHPDLLIAQHPELATTFVKGDVPCETPEEDTSYTSFLAHHPTTNITLPTHLKEQAPEAGLIIAGNAIGDGDKHPLCVDSTVLDFHEAGFEVSIVIDAVEAINPENREICFRNLAQAGIRLITTEQAIAQVQNRQL